MLAKRVVALNKAGAVWLERTFPGTFGGLSCVDELKKHIEIALEQQKPNTILEVGGIDRPMLEKGSQFNYVGLDIEDRPGCHRIYDRFIVQSIERPVHIRTDMVISLTVLEHVPNNKAAIASIFGALSPGGVTHHYLPSKWHPYSVLLRVVGTRGQRILIGLLRPWAKDVTGYPAYFDHCSPGEMAALFKQAGFENIEVQPFYRANDYFAFFLPAYVVVSLFENLCAALGARALCSGFNISARKPKASLSA